MELRNDGKTLMLINLFLKLRERLGDNLIKVSYEEDKKIIVYTREKVEVEGVEVKDLKSYVEDAFKVRGVDKVEVELDKEKTLVKVFISSVYPELYENLYVILYEVKKEFGIDIDLKTIELT
jgi:hypothetical protein